MSRHKPLRNANGRGRRAAETRCEELRQAEVSARSDAGYWKWHFKACRSKLDAAVEETKELGRSVKEMPSLLAEVTYLRKLVGQATRLQRGRHGRGFARRGRQAA